MSELHPVARVVGQQTRLSIAHGLLRPPRTTPHLCALEPLFRSHWNAVSPRTDAACLAISCEGRESPCREAQAGRRDGGEAVVLQQLIQAGK